jgi:hypothetical protein
MSLTSQVGLAGVSSQMSRVLPRRTAAKSASVSQLSTTSTSSRPPVAHLKIQPFNAQYIALGTTTCAPGSRLMNTAVAAAMPEAKTRARLPPSRRASVASGSRYAGEPSRA